MYSHAIRHNVLISAQLSDEYFHKRKVQYYMPLILLFLHFVFSSNFFLALRNEITDAGILHVWADSEPSLFDRGTGQIRC